MFTTGRRPGPGADDRGAGDENLAWSGGGCESGCDVDHVPQGSQLSDRRQADRAHEHVAGADPDPDGRRRVVDRPVASPEQPGPAAIAGRVCSCPANAGMKIPITSSPTNLSTIASCSTSSREGDVIEAVEPPGTRSG